MLSEHVTEFAPVRHFHLAPPEEVGRREQAVDLAAVGFVVVFDVEDAEAGEAGRCRG